MNYNITVIALKWLTQNINDVNYLKYATVYCAYDCVFVLSNDSNPDDGV